MAENSFEKPYVFWKFEEIMKKKIVGWTTKAVKCA